MVKFLLDYKFRVTKFGQYKFQYSYDSPNIPLIYKNVALYWCLEIYPNGGMVLNDVTRYHDIGIVLRYKDGPQKEVSVLHEFYVLKNGCRLFCCRESSLRHLTRGLGTCCFSNLIPSKIQALVDKNCLSDMNTILHIQAELQIPVEAFYDPANQYPGVVAVPDDSEDFCQNLTRKEFENINNKADDDDLFEMISRDKRHFWVHKNIMIKRSPVFKTMFSSDAGKDGPIREYNKTVSVDVSGVALEEILQFMYMGFVNKMSYNTIKDVMLFASMHFLDDLKAICVKQLLTLCKSTDLVVDQVIDMSMESEKHQLKEVKEFCISFLTKYWIDAIENGCFMPNLVFNDEVGTAFLRDLFTNIQKELDEQDEIVIMLI